MSDTIKQMNNYAIVLYDNVPVPYMFMINLLALVSLGFVHASELFYFIVE